MIVLTLVTTACLGEFRDTYKDRDQLEAKDLIMHDDNTKPIEATSANLSQIHHNAYVMLFRKI